VDVRAGQLATTLKALRDIGFLDGVRNGDFSFVLLHVLGSSIASLDEISETAPFISDASYFLVKNFINDTQFFEWDPQTYASYFRKVRHAGEITIPKLNEMAYEQVELAAMPFASFIGDQKIDGEPSPHSFVLRGYARTWMRQVSAEFDRIGLLGLVDGKDVERRSPRRRERALPAEQRREVVARAGRTARSGKLARRNDSVAPAVPHRGAEGRRERERESSRGRGVY
jgi:hypothetical protein